MNNYKIIIDASHGGEDVGLLWNNIPEKNITLEISKYMYQKLKEYKVSAVMIRNEDETISPKERIKRITELYGDHKYVIVISNHMHKAENYKIVYGLRRNHNLPNRVASCLIKKQENVDCYFKRLGSNPHLDYYDIHRDTANMEVIRISYPLIQNRNDLDKNIEAIVETIYEYIGGKVETNTYQVVSGDTMWNVAKKFNLNIDELKWLNGFSDNLLRTGDIIKVKKECDEKKVANYVVGAGENLYQISRKFHTSVEDLMNYNHLKSNLIQIGEIIKIPIYSFEHIIQDGENIYQLAKDYQKEVDELMYKNNLETGKLEPGSYLTI